MVRFFLCVAVCLATLPITSFADSAQTHVAKSKTLPPDTTAIIAKSVKVVGMLLTQARKHVTAINKNLQEMNNKQKRRSTRAATLNVMQGANAFVLEPHSPSPLKWNACMFNPTQNLCQP